MRRIINTTIWKKQFLEHPGIADGKVSDLDLLAAVCDAEAGDQGVDRNGSSCTLCTELYH